MCLCCLWKGVIEKVHDFKGFVGGVCEPVLDAVTQCVESCVPRLTLGRRDAAESSFVDAPA
jgi:hypothetical protein